MKPNGYHNKTNAGGFATQIEIETSTVRTKPPNENSMGRNAHTIFWPHRGCKVRVNFAWPGDESGGDEISHRQGTGIRSSSGQHARVRLLLSASASSFHIPGMCWIKMSKLWIRWKRKNAARIWHMPAEVDKALAWAASAEVLSQANMAVIGWLRPLRTWSKQYARENCPKSSQTLICFCIESESHANCSLASW